MQIFLATESRYASMCKATYRGLKLALNWALHVDHCGLALQKIEPLVEQKSFKKSTKTFLALNANTLGLVS